MRGVSLRKRERNNANGHVAEARISALRDESVR